MFFRGGRINGWVARNRQPLETNDYVSEEIKLLEQFSPNFARNTNGLTLEQKVQFIRKALQLADQSPLSATNQEYKSY